MGDVVQLPLALVQRSTTDVLTGAHVSASITGDVLMSALSPVDLGPLARVRQLLELKIGSAKAPVSLTLDAQAGSFTDRVTRPLVVKPKGFPYEKAFGGLLSAKAPASHVVTIPSSAVPGSLVATANVFPTPLANMTEALARLIQEPYGCFEQTSSTSYPLTMAQQYFLSHQGVDPKMVASAKEKLETSYKRLVGFECSEKGYEWFGENPGHEALTAYGLLHFTDMAQVRDVDATMLRNTRAWLMKQRDGSGGFNRKRRALHTWVEDKDSSNAYITWALLESGEQDLKPELSALKAQAAASKNSYVWALAANALWLGGDKESARALMQKLQAAQLKDGAVGGATQSIVGSGGEALSVETTSLAALAWMREPQFAGSVETAIRYLADVCKGGRYGSTQSTVARAARHRHLRQGALAAEGAGELAHLRRRAAGRQQRRVRHLDAGRAEAPRRRRAAHARRAPRRPQDGGRRRDALRAHRQIQRRHAGERESDQGLAHDAADEGHRRRGRDARGPRHRHQPHRCTASHRRRHRRAARRARAAA